MNEFIFGSTRFKLNKISNRVFSDDMPGQSLSKNRFELHYIENGKGSLCTKTNKHDLKKGVFYVTGPEIWYQRFTDRNEPLNEYCIYFQCEEKAKDLISEIFISTSFYFGENNSIIRYAFKQVMQLENDSSIFSKQNQLIYVQLIMSELSALYTPSIKDSELSTLEDRKNIIIEDAFSYDYKDITLSSLSEKLGLRERQTQRLIKKFYGKTFSQKKTEARMKKAKQLLNENMRVGEVSKAVGYSDTPAFEKAYKAYFGTTPTHGREKSI